MWQPSQVERILFQWHRWRRSLVAHWTTLGNQPPELSQEHLTMKARDELDALGLPRSLLMELYWSSVAVSDVNLDYPSTFQKMVIPAGWVLPDTLGVYPGSPPPVPGSRVFPPRVVTEADADNAFQQHGPFAVGGILTPGEGYPWILLPAEHELVDALNQARGRPRHQARPGRAPAHADRLAVQCACRKDGSGWTYLKIAAEFGLEVTEPWGSKQSDTTRHLVARGRRILQSVGLSTLSPENP